jgi:hypothetical protein
MNNLFEPCNYEEYIGASPVGEIFLGYAFKELYSTFISGTPVKRRKWKGYWIYNSIKNDIEIHTKDGDVILFSQVGNILYTLSHLGECDWEIATEQNCGVPIK